MTCQSLQKNLGFVGKKSTVSRSRSGSGAILEVHRGSLFTGVAEVVGVRRSSLAPDLGGGAAGVEREDTTRKRDIDGIDTNGAPDIWCAITIY